VLTVKTVDAVAVLEGSPAPGFAVVGVNLRPDRIVLKGPATMLADIETVKTHPINLEAASESFKKEVPLILPEAIAVDPPLRIVVAEVAVRERIVTRVFERIPVSVNGSSAAHQVRPETITLSVSGPEMIVATIESDPAFGVSVDLSGLMPGTHLLKATINLPIQTTLVQVSPEQFSVTIEK
jgi:YbbR domain-containing protein